MKERRFIETSIPVVIAEERVPLLVDAAMGCPCSQHHDGRPPGHAVYARWKSAGSCPCGNDRPKQAGLQSGNEDVAPRSRKPAAYATAAQGRLYGRTRTPRDCRKRALTDETVRARPGAGILAVRNRHHSPGNLSAWYCGSPRLWFANAHIVSSTSDGLAPMAWCILRAKS